MKEGVYIPKNRQKPPAEDFDFLRAEGLKYIENLGHKLWTDYNVHDPGITIMEVLCYAITDLSYRSSFSIPDLLASGKSVSKSFFTAREILSCNPLTKNDYRKLLIDVEGVKNAWVSLVVDYQPLIYADCKKSILRYEEPLYHALEVRLKGMYDIQLELDSHPVFGDLNDYSFLQLIGQKRVEVSLPAWDELFPLGVDVSKIKDIDLSYTSYNNIARIHTFKVELKGNSGVLHTSEGGIASGSPVSEVEAKQLLENLFDNEELVLSPYLLRLQKALEVATEAYNILHNHRNLSEDFRSLSRIDVEDIVLCADIEVGPGAEIEEVWAEIHYRISKHLSPAVIFYTLQELIDSGKTTAEIFNGPALNHGFISNEELKASELKKQVQVSDLIRIIMEIEGVVAVKKIMLSSLFHGNPVHKDEKWLLPVTSGRAPRLNLERSKTTFYKSSIPYYANNQRAIEIFEHKQLLERGQKLGADIYDIPVPEGEKFDLHDYKSIQNDLPLTYGVGNRGIPGLVDENRKAKAKQLKAYLLFFDQILANYLAQLNHVGELLSFEESTKRTSFFQLLYNVPVNPDVLSVREQVPEVYKLIGNFIDQVPEEDVDKPETYREEWVEFKEKLNNEFVEQLSEITETSQVFEERRNLFLDHLLSRFSEKFTDYVLLMYKLDGKRSNIEIINDKIRFLKDYPVLSHDRGRAFNYTLTKEIWNTENVSGFEKRLARLTGIENFNRRYLQCKEPEINHTIYKDVANEWRFNIKDENDKVLLKSEGYTTKASAKKGIKSVFINGIDYGQYHLKHAVNNKFYYNLRAKNGEIIGTSIIFDSKQDRDNYLIKLVEILRNDCGDEGFHLVEHLLLRPRKEGDPLMEVCLEPDCNSCEGNIDPYSFRLTLVLPAWANRFMNMNFRNYFEHIARMEAPAHLHLKICWVDLEDMIEFENAYKAWLQVNAAPNSTEESRKKKLEKLLSVLTQLKSVFPVATLHNCEESEDENPVLLGKTILGSSKTIES